MIRSEAPEYLGLFRSLVEQTGRATADQLMTLAKEVTDIRTHAHIYTYRHTYKHTYIHTPYKRHALIHFDGLLNWT